MISLRHCLISLSTLTLFGPPRGRSSTRPSLMNVAIILSPHVVLSIRSPHVYLQKLRKILFNSISFIFSAILRQ